MSVPDRAHALRPHPTNPRYFADADGRARLLVGSHTWANFQERGIADETPDFDFPAYLDFLVDRGHSFVRFWVWEHARGVQWSDAPIRFTPLPYPRSGGGVALDGGARFDLEAFDPAFFERLRERVAAAVARELVVSVMLFQGFSVARNVAPGATSGGDPWLGHPFHRDNNANEVDGDPERRGHGRAVHTLADSRITALQEHYVARVVEAVDGLGPVLFEVGNELHPDSWEWQRHIADTVRRRASAHPALVGQGASFPHGESNARLAASDADWISPEHTVAEPYKWDPPAVPAVRPVLLDTDHLWGIGGDADWVWRAFFRGANPIVMDPWADVRFAGTLGDTRDDARWESVRRALGAVRRLADRIDLASLAPHPERASSGYALSDGRSELLAYWPPPGRGLRRWHPKHVRWRVDLPGTTARWEARWIDPVTETAGETRIATGDSLTAWRMPTGGARILHLRRRD